MRHWWRTRTVRFRLAAWYAIGGTILLTAFSATIYIFVEHRMARPLDHQLQRDLATVQAHLKIEADGSVLWDGREVLSGASWPPHNPWFELWDEKGQLIRRFWPFNESRLEQLPVGPARNRETISVFRVSPDVRLRVLSVPLAIENREEAWMVRVMSIHEPAGNALGALVLIIAVALPVVVMLLVFVGFTFTRRWLKPLDQMVIEAHRITAHDLNRRLPVENPHDELGRLAAVFNVTLARLEDSFSALDRFVSDASHELLTPLTTLRSVGEVGLLGVRSPDVYREVIASMLEEAQRLQVLVEKLLQLARAEGGAATMLERTLVELDELARHCADDASILAENKNQRILVETIPCAVKTDSLLLRQALQNLVDNAMKYSAAGSVIIIKIQQTTTEVKLSVTDNGPGVRDDQRSRLTDRFFRADEARGSSGGYGLGLAITKAYMRVLGGSLTYESAQPQGSVFCLTLPKI
jgi:heavy metal sensor kinase